jgi:putative PIN family toxin of toxin-antitoxin system
VLRVVIDTNVFVSALLSPNGAPAQVLNAWRERRFLLLTSPEIIAEVAETLSRFIGRTPYDVAQDDVDGVVTLLKNDAVEVLAGADVSDADIPDPDDLIFLACAVDGNADAIVSGDKHLKSLGVYRGIPILTARDFVEQLNQANE